MTYIYSSLNRLDNPHNYMYTEYEGAQIFNDFEKSRLDFLKKILSAEVVADAYEALIEDKLLDLFLVYFDKSQTDSYDSLSTDILRRLPRARAMEIESEAFDERDFNLELNVKTVEVLKMILNAQIRGVEFNHVNLWLDRLIQRFEVTKKLFEEYLPGFRKGTGSSSVIRLYWLFSMALGIQYFKSSNIKYLSTLCKVNDLIVSVPDSLKASSFSSFGFGLVFFIELKSVMLLAEGKGVVIAAG